MLFVSDSLFQVCLNVCRTKPQILSNVRCVFPDAFSWNPGVLRGNNKGLAIRFDYNIR